MAVMFGNLYRALTAAGVADEQAQKAAEEVASYENRLASLDGKVTLLQWMVGVNLAFTLGIALKLLVPAGP
jgi:hypothetical protein